MQLKLNNNEADPWDGWKEYKNTNLWFNEKGECRSKRMNTTIGYKTGYRKDAQGYRLIRLLNRKNKTIHRIIMELFGPPKPNETEDWTVDHIDNNNQNNHIKNLQWLTRSEHGKKSSQQVTATNRRAQRKLTFKQSQKIKKLYTTGKYSCARLAKKYKISTTAIRLIIKNKTYRYDYTPDSKANAAKREERQSEGRAGDGAGAIGITNKSSSKQEIIQLSIFDIRCGYIESPYELETRREEAKQYTKRG